MLIRCLSQAISAIACLTLKTAAAKFFPVIFLCQIVKYGPSGRSKRSPTMFSPFSSLISKFPSENSGSKSTPLSICVLNGSVEISGSVG